ncbi:MAG: hypothetical protein ACOYNY_27530 [Caldilineaceae bacterium]
MAISLLGKIFYYNKQFWLDYGPYWLVWGLYQGYCNPAFIISLVGFIFHPSVIWFFAFIIAFFLHIMVFTWADAQCSLKHLTEAYNDIVREGDYFLRQVDNSVTQSIHEFSAIKAYQKAPEAVKEFIKLNTWYHPLFKEPLKVFTAESNDGKAWQEPKAYTNFQGRSLVFLHHPFHQMDAFDRFLLLHELEHVNLNGARQLSQVYSRPIFLIFNMILLSFMAVSWWHWPIIAIYTVLNLLAYSQAISKREVIADNGALLKLSNIEEQKEVVKDLIEYAAANLQSKGINLSWIDSQIDFQQDNKNALLREFIKFRRTNKLKSDWIDRLLHFRWYENRLNKGEQLPHLGWTSFHDNVAMFPFNLFILYLGITTLYPPVFPFVIMFTFMIFDIAWLQFKYMNQLAEINTKIEARIVS